MWYPLFKLQYIQPRGVYLPGGWVYLPGGVPDPGGVPARGEVPAGRQVIGMVKKIGK